MRGSTLLLSLMVAGWTTIASSNTNDLESLSKAELINLVQSLRLELNPTPSEDINGYCDGDDCADDEAPIDYSTLYKGLWESSDGFVTEKLTPISLPSPEKDAKIAKFQSDRLAAVAKELTPEEKSYSQEIYNRNKFDQYISDQIPMDRLSRDTRPPQCVHEEYAPLDQMPSVSVIVVFFNEARSTLLRTAWSVINKTPPGLIKEILLVDDGSEFEHLHDALDEEVKSIPKTRVVRLGERVGLIQAKVLGVENATGDVLAFMDSHCEVVDGWLEPLLDRIMRNPRAVALPVVDPIDYDTFEHKEAIVEMGVSSWWMHFYWMPPPQTKMNKHMKLTTPFKSPIMAGGIFAMGREYFIQSGAYDMGMDTWGGENFEMSFRIWMCGGVLESVPCSHIGHVFRASSPYKFKNRDPLITIAHNLNRVAQVWMDEPYRQVYYNMTKNHKMAGHGDVAERKQLRKDLQCKSFDWYMKNVAEYMFTPTPDHYLEAGLLRNEHSKECLYHEGNPDGNRILAVTRSCAGPGTEGPESVYWYLTKDPVYGEIRTEKTYGARCLHAHEIKKNARLELARCWDNELEDGRLKWDYDKETKQIHLSNFPTGCLTQNPKFADQVIISKCKPNWKHQQWTFVDHWA